MHGQEAFQKIEECLMTDAKPSAQLRTLAKQVWFSEFPFLMILSQQKTEQSPIYHPEGSVWEHTLLVVDEAAKRKSYSTNPRVFMWSALLHDIGKPQTTKVHKGKITAYNHDQYGAELTREFFSALTNDNAFIENVFWLVRYHMQILFVTKSLPFQDIRGMKEHTEVRDVALLGYCDRLGRTGVNCDAERKAVKTFLQKCEIKPEPSWLSL